ncbi:hypothetical protein ACQJBY_010654 [Aegilops geniculata]
MKTTAFDGSCRIKRQPKIPMKKFLFIVKQQVGSLVYGKDHKVMRPKKTFRLCIRDEYGMRALAKPAAVLKSTALRHEIELCTGRWRLITMVNLGKINSWPVYMESGEIIISLSRTIDSAIIKYRERRFEAGLFYLVPNKNLTFTVRSYLYGDGDFLRDLRKKKRLEHTMREKKQHLRECFANVCESDISEGRNLSSVVFRTLRLCGMRHVSYLLLLISLAFMIVYV